MRRTGQVITAMERRKGDIGALGQRSINGGIDGGYNNKTISQTAVIDLK